MQFQHAAFFFLNIGSTNPSATSTCKYKYKELEALLADSCSDVPVKFIAITETWLQDDIKDAQLTTEGFNIARCDRGDRVVRVFFYIHIRTTLHQKRSVRNTMNPTAWGFSLDFRR